MTLATSAVAGGLVLDLVLGEPPDRLHPVAWFGRVADAADRSWPAPRLTGAVLALGLPTAAATLAALGVFAAGALSAWVALPLAAMAVFLTTSYRSLLDTAGRVERLATDDPEAARAALRALAGRDASALTVSEVRSAVLESIAENLADGLVAPLAGFGIGALVGWGVGLSPTVILALACAGAVFVKAVNTLDSMWGYPDRPLGTGAARLDDFVMWLPARLTAVGIALAFSAPAAIPQSANWVGDVASPNAGWPMGALAAALDVRLEKPGHYVLNRDGSVPNRSHVRRALRRISLLGLVTYAVVGVVVWS